jgi:hypothetical protein
MALPSTLAVSLPIPYSMVSLSSLSSQTPLSQLSFVDTFSTPILLNPSSSDTSQEYVFSATGITWPGEAKKYVTNPVGSGGYSSYSDIVPPPNWALRFPNGYSNSTPPPDLKSDERFQNWMRTAGLPTFTKLYGRNDSDTMQKGRYRIVIGLSTCSPVDPVTAP